MSDGAPATATVGAGSLYSLKLAGVFEDAEGHELTYSYDTEVVNDHTKIENNTFYFTAEALGDYEVTLTAECSEGEKVEHQMTITVEKPSEGIDAQYGYDETDKASVTVYVNLSNDGMPLVAADGTVMANLKVTVPYFDLSLYGMEEFYRYGTDGGRGKYTGTDVIQRPTGLHLYIYLLERYYMGLEES